MKKMAILHRMFGFRLRKTTRIGDLGEQKPKRRNSQPLVVPDSVISIYVLVLPPKTSHFSVGGLSQRLSLISPSQREYKCTIDAKKYLRLRTSICDFGRLNDRPGKHNYPFVCNVWKKAAARCAKPWGETNFWILYGCTL